MLQSRRTAAARMLCEHQPEPYSHLPVAVKASRVANGGDQSPGRDLGPMFELFASMPQASPTQCRLDLRLEFSNLFVDLHEVVQQTLHE